MPTILSSNPLRAWVATLLAGMCVVSFLPRFFRYIQAEPGSTPWDPLLTTFTPIDLSALIFVVLYGTIVLALSYLIRHPENLLRGVQAYVMLLILRMVSMALVPLEPPSTLIPLIDPVTQVFYPNTTPFSKDLFFSGHTATMFLVFLLLRKSRVGLLLFVATLFIGAGVLVQHVHWTVDVLFAPLAAWLAWWASGHTVHWGVSASSATEAA